MKKQIILLILCVGLSNTVMSQTVTIGTQVWMTENLNVDKFRNGDVIPHAKTVEEWLTAGDNQQPAWCYYKNDSANSAKYGKLYNWYAVNDSRGLAPQGWHVASDAEWTKLTDYLGGAGVAGKKMKMGAIYETKISYVEEGGYYENNWVACTNCKSWNREYKSKVPCHVCKDTRGRLVKGKFIPKTKRKIEEKIKIEVWNGTNESGFSGRPGGSIQSFGQSYGEGTNAHWWTSTSVQDEEFQAWTRTMNYYDEGVVREKWAKNQGMYVRCIKD